MLHERLLDDCLVDTVVDVIKLAAWNGPKSKNQMLFAGLPCPWVKSLSLSLRLCKSTSIEV